jgi:hypothetical protein
LAKSFDFKDVFRSSETVAGIYIITDSITDTIVVSIIEVRTASKAIGYRVRCYITLRTASMLFDIKTAFVPKIRLKQKIALVIRI